MAKRKMIYKRSWNSFRKAGLLWWINRTLHFFGWAIIVDLDDNDRIVDVYPARMKFRGFSPAVETRGFRKLTKYIQKNADRIYKDGFEEKEN